MAGGFLSGALWGGVLSIGVGTVVSVIAPLPPQSHAISPEVSETAPEVGEVPATEVAETPDVVVSKEDATPIVSDSVPQVDVPDTDTLGALDQTIEVAPAVPVTNIIAGLDAPADGPATGALALSDEDPVFPNPQALAPMIPQDADAVSIDTAPASPPKPTLPEDEGTTAESAVTEVIEETPSEPDTVMQEVEADQTQAEQTVDESDVPTLKPVDPPARVVTAEPETETEQAAEPRSEIATQAPSEETAPEAVTQTSPEAVEQEDAPQVAMLVPSARPQIGTPAISLTDRSSGVTINRPVDPETEALPVTIITEEGSSPQGGDLRPIKRYAQAFANPEGKPLMAVVLIDDGTSPTAGKAGIAALRSFPYALSFAVDSSLPDAADRMAIYRDAGFEVLAMVDLPQGARPSDVETTFGVTLSQMREVVGVLEGTGGGLQGSRVVSDQVAAVLAQTGHGLVTQDKGLNTMPKLARKDGVPADPVFRDFDSKGQNAQVIRRFLDQAAFKAGQEGAVIMLGRMRPDTISALLLWGLQDRAGKVALAPISAILTRDGG